MRLTISNRFLRGARLAATGLLATPALLAAPAPLRAQPAPADTTGPPPDPLGSLVVTPGASRPLPKIAVVPSLSSDLADVVVHSVVERDLDLCGEFELLPAKQVPADTYADSPVDTQVWSKTGVLAVVAVNATTAGDKVTLSARAYLVKKGDSPVIERKTTVPAASVRAESHRTADVLIGALTGQNGGFYSHMIFTSGVGPVRMAYVVDSDGHDLRAVSKPDELTIGTAFGKGNEPYWVSSVANEPYRIRTKNGPIALPIAGSVYGLAFSKDRSRVAVSIGTDDGIRLFEGKDFASLSLFSTLAPAMEPTFTPSGRLAFSGAGRYGFRIYVEQQAPSGGASAPRGAVPITPEGSSASSPTVCNHPDGVRVLFAAGPGKKTDLYSTGESGGGSFRLTVGGQSSAPACSPDGRLVAFFSTKTTGEGPGLYIMRADGQRPKRISTMIGDALRWDPIAGPAAPASPAPVSSARNTNAPSPNASTPSAVPANVQKAAPTAEGPRGGAR